MADENLDIALDILKVALRIAPSLIDWIRDLVEGKFDPVSLRVKNILPEESDSERAAREIRAQQLADALARR